MNSIIDEIRIQPKGIKLIQTQKMKAWRTSGILLIATGILHTIIALAMHGERYWMMTQEGLWNTVGTNVERNASLWFLVTGLFVILFGQVLHHYIIRNNSPAPLFVGWWLTIVSIVGGFIQPVSGFWLFLPQGLIIIIAHRKKNTI